MLCVCAWGIYRFEDCWLRSDWLLGSNFLLLQCNGMYTCMKHTPEALSLMHACMYVCMYAHTSYVHMWNVHTYKHTYSACACDVSTYVCLLGAQICWTSAWDVGIGCDSVYPGLWGEPFPWCGGDYRRQTPPTLSGIPKWVMQSAVTTTHLCRSTHSVTCIMWGANC